MTPHAPTPEWAISRVRRIIKTDDPDALDALLELLAGVAPTRDEEKYKFDAAQAAMQYGYRQTRDCEEACRRYLGLTG